MSFQNKSLETVQLKKLSKPAYDRVRHLLNIWRIGEKAGNQVRAKKRAVAANPLSPGAANISD
jgi:hypothetical protein